MSSVDDVRDDEWLVTKARLCRKQDLFAARSWLIVAKTLFPRNFSIQFEMYQLEKNGRNIHDMVRLFEEMLTNFSNESQLWTEILSMSEALQSDATDDQSVFLREVFNSLPQKIQCSILLRAADKSTDVLQQCRLLLLVVDRYPLQVPDQGEKLVESLLQAEQMTRVLLPVNCYRKYLACSVLPLLLRVGQPKLSPVNLCRWLRKAVEFYISFIAQKSMKELVLPNMPSTASTNLPDPSDIIGMTDKDSPVIDPWHQMFELIHLVADNLQWNIGRLFLGDSLENQWHQITEMADGLRMAYADSVKLDVLSQQLLLCTSVLLVQCLNAYQAIVDPSSSSGQGSSSGHVPLVMVEIFRTDSSDGSLEHKAKRMKTELELPRILVSNKVSSSGNREDVVQNFLMALNCWQLLHSPVLESEFVKLSCHWSAERWSWLSRFETDVLLYQGLHKEVIKELQPVQSAQLSSASRHRQMSLQLACCYYGVASYTAVLDMILYIFGTFQPNPGSLLSDDRPIAQGKSRQLQLLSLNDSEMFSYCIHLLIACLKDKAYMMDVTSDTMHGYVANVTQDLILGHVMVLMQYDWPRYELVMSEIISGIKRRGHFTYNLFFTYIINIDLLEEFAYLKTTEGGKVNLDILPTPSGKGLQTRTVTRGVNKGAKEDFKVAMEKQVARSEENIAGLLRTFILDEADLISKNLMS